MKIKLKELSRVIQPILACKYPVLIRGRHGIGKSEFVQQLAVHIKYPLMEKRASQMTEGDLIGLPVIKGDTTAWNPPDWFKFSCDNAVVLFLDELDRASNEVRQGFFELADSRKINGWKLHPDTIVIAAINATDDYQVNIMDPAEVDRWTVFDVQMDKDDLFAYFTGSSTNFPFTTIATDTSSVTEALKGSYKVEPIVAEFLREYPDFLEHTGEYEDNNIYPSPRSWERFGKTLAVFMEGTANPAKDLIRIICRAFVGDSASDKFHAYFSLFGSMKGTLDSLSFDEIQDLFVANPGHQYIIFFLQKSFRSIKGEKLSAKKIIALTNNIEKLFPTLTSEVKSLLISYVLSTKNVDLIKSVMSSSEEMQRFVTKFKLEESYDWKNTDKTISE